MQRYREAAEAFRGCGDVVSEATRLLRLVEWTETRVILQKNDRTMMRVCWRVCCGRS